MAICKICKTEVHNKIKGTFLNNFLCPKCATGNKDFIARLKIVEERQLFLINSINNTNKAKAEKERTDNQKIPFNYWIIEERQKEKKFLEQQSNKDFLAEQFKNDLNYFVNEL